MNFNDNILVLDGAMGTMIQKYGLDERDFHKPVQADDCGDQALAALKALEQSRMELKGNNECLNLTRPDIIFDIHRKYIEAGADIIESNTFSANSISQEEYGLADIAGEMAREGAAIARRAADQSGRKVYVAGSVGPTSKSLTLAQNVEHPEYRPYSFREMAAAYKEQIRGLIDGGADFIQIETCFDALNAKAAIYAL